MFESTVKAVQRDLYAAQVHGIVSYFANHLRLLVTYGDIASALKVTPRGGQLAQALAAITEADYKAKRPPSTAVVVNKHLGRPGSGFFVQCRELGWPVGASEADEEAFWHECLRRLKVAPYTLDAAADPPEGPVPERREEESLSEYVARVKSYQAPHTREAMSLTTDESPTHRRGRTTDPLTAQKLKATDRGPSLNVKKRPLDAPDDEDVLRARLKQADKAGWTGPTKDDPEPEVEPVGHSMLPGDTTC